MTTATLHPSAPQHLPPFITAPGDTDVLFVVTTAFLLVSVLVAGNLFLRLHTLPERMAHKSQKLQFEIVAVVDLLVLHAGRLKSRPASSLSPTRPSHLRRRPIHMPSWEPEPCSNCCSAPC